MKRTTSHQHSAERPPRLKRTITAWSKDGYFALDSDKRFCTSPDLKENGGALALLLEGVEILYAQEQQRAKKYHIDGIVLLDFQIPDDPTALSGIITDNPKKFVESLHIIHDEISGLDFGRRELSRLMSQDLQSFLAELMMQ